MPPEHVPLRVNEFPRVTDVFETVALSENSAATFTSA